MIVAVIDLGTNTCNLLVAGIQNKKFEILHQSKQLVKMGDQDIISNRISTDALKRVQHCFAYFKEIIQQFKAEKIRIVSTSAVRDAENKIEILEMLCEQTGWIVKILSGEREAQLIFEGVLLALEKLEQPTVVLDIGGGSNELILAQKNAVIWKESKPTGMARVINQFALSDPLKPEELIILREFFWARHSTAIQKCNESEAKTLIGCSGAFDTIADIIDEVNPGEKLRRKQEIPLADFQRVYRLIVHSTRGQRTQMKGMDMVRVDLIVPAMIFIQQLIAQTGINKIIQTDFALREGVLYEMMGNVV
jgi:exopolyphosphatase/guanosine-5'-triphosphate,3'-diphosphate pyrophosphatase